jgi:hypothetical protein
MPLSQIQGWVTTAEATGGWLHIVFHHLCASATGCDQYGITTADFGTFLDWLVARSDTIALERDVVGGSTKALVTLANPVFNPSMEGSTDGGLPLGWQRGGSGTNTATWTTTTDAHTGVSAQRVDVTNYVSGSAILVPTQNVFGIPGLPGHLYAPTGWYRSTAPPRWTLYWRDQNGAWTWWAQSAPLATSAGWTQASWTTPALPSTATGLSFGLAVTANGSMTLDDYGVTDLGLAPTNVTVTSPVSGSSVRGTVPISVSASAPTGVTRIDVFAAGALVGSASTSPSVVNWDSTQVGDGPVTLSASVLDGSGKTVQSSPVTVTVTNAAGLLSNPSLESDVAPADGVPDCWTRAGYGTNTATWTTTTDAHAGSSAQRVDVTAWTSGAQRLVPTQDASACAPPGVVGHTYRVTGWYKATAQPRWVFYYRDSTGAWVWWAQSALLPVASAYTQSTFVTPALPAGASAISFGLSLYSTGSLTVDDFTFFDLN